jgi:hypothetical protein
MDRVQRNLLGTCAAFGLLAIAPALHAVDDDLARKTRQLDEHTQTLKREVLELGRNIAYLAWVGGVKPVGDPRQSGNRSFNLKALSDDTVRMGQALALLEDGVLSPPGFQMVVFTSLDANEDFELHEVTLKIDDKLVMRRRYEADETAALREGGAHRLYIGNVPEGRHQLTAFVIGARGGKKPQQENLSMQFDKAHQRKTIELRVSSFLGATRINAKEWE